MIITSLGHYLLTKDYPNRGTSSIGTLPAGLVIEITQIDRENRKVIGPELADWNYHDMPVVPWSRLDQATQQPTQELKP